MKISIISKAILITALYLIISKNSIAQQNKTLEFDGVDDIVHISDNNNLDLSTSGTLEAWIYLNYYEDYAGIIHKGDNDNFDDEAYTLQMGGNKYIPGSDNTNVVLAIFNSSSQNVLYSNASLATDTWYHIAAVWNSSNMYLYINGKLDKSCSNSISARNTTGGLNIGSQLYNSKDVLNFHGKIDEVRIWSDARTQNEIRDWMHKTDDLTSQSNLVSVWHLNESSIGTNSVIDSKNSNNGTPSNMDNSNCVTSTAPIGDKSHIGTSTNNITENTDITVDITWDTGGDPGTDAIFSAIQMNESPTVTTGLLAYKADKFWEIWIENDDGSYQSDIKFHYDNIGGIDDEAELKLYTRANNGDSWSEVANYTIVSNDGASSTNTDGIGYIEAQDLTGFSQFIITSSDGDNSTLPIELIYFSANCEEQNIVKLSWTTASETNNSHFEIQQSYDGINFTKIGNVNGAGNSNSILSYKFLHKNIEDFSSYYRLKQVDFNGKFEYSKIIATNCDNPLNSIEVFPNPFKNEILINFNNITNYKQKLQLRNYLGVLIKEIYLDKNNSNYKMELEENLSSGIYFIVISNDKEKIVRKLVKE